MTQTLLVSLQVLHLLFAIYWFGSLLYTEIILWPRLRAAGMLAEVQGQLRSPELRRFQAIPIVGTILSGYARGAVGGVFDRLYSPYGVLFVLAAIVGTAMIIWWLSFPPRTMKTGWRMFYSGFWVMFALMIGLRFNA